MIAVSVSEVEKNPKIIFEAVEPINVLDKNKNVNLGIFYPKIRKKNVVDELAGSLGSYISDDKKNISWEEVREKTYELRREDLNKKYKAI